MRLRSTPLKQKPLKYAISAAFLLFVFCSEAVPSYSSRSQENEIHLDFSKSVQRVGGTGISEFTAFSTRQASLQREAQYFSVFS